jgi:hypothetical protein
MKLYTFFVTDSVQSILPCFAFTRKTEGFALEHGALSEFKLDPNLVQPATASRIEMKVGFIDQQAKILRKFNMTFKQKGKSVLVHVVIAQAALGRCQVHSDHRHAPILEATDEHDTLSRIYLINEFGIVKVVIDGLQYALGCSHTGDLLVFKQYVL